MSNGTQECQIKAENSETGYIHQGHHAPAGIDGEAAGLQVSWRQASSQQESSLNPQSSIHRKNKFRPKTMIRFICKKKTKRADINPPNLLGFGHWGAPGAAQHPLLHTEIKLKHRVKGCTHNIHIPCLCNMHLVLIFFFFYLMRRIKNDTIHFIPQKRHQMA